MKIQRRIKRHIKRALAGAALAAMLFTVPAFAMPQGGTVKVGDQITITIPNGNEMKIAVGANGVIDWSSFSIAKEETVNFNFADMYAVLNRVTGSQMSELHGTLTSSGADGSVFLVNPNGVLVGSGATINTSNLVLSTLNVSDDNFMQLVGAWKTDDEHPLTFTKDSRQTVAGEIKIESGATIQHPENKPEHPIKMGYLGLIGGSITIAPNVTIETSMDSSFVAADKATINYMQHRNGAIEHYDTASFNTQAANRVMIKGNIASNSINIHGDTITLDQAKLTTNWLDVFAGTSFESAGKDDRYIGTLTATPDNKITLTGSSIVLTNGCFDEEYVVAMLGGQVDMKDSSITAGEKITNDSPRVVIAAANSMQWQFGGRDLDDDDSAFVGIDIQAAAPNNAIALNNVSIATETPHKDTANILILGGKVDVTGASTIKGNEVFIGAGSKLGVEAAYDEERDVYYSEYYFTNHFKSSLGNTVTLGKDVHLVANGESAIFANAFTNAGKIEAHGHYGFNIRAVDEWTLEEKSNTGYQISSKNNKVINTGVISADQANFDPSADREYGIIGIDASIIDNTGGTITASRHPDAIKDPNHFPDADLTTGAADLLAVGTVTGVDPADKSIKVSEMKLDLNKANYKLIWQGEGDMEAPAKIEELPLPTNPAIDDILKGSGSLEEKQAQIIAAINTVNSLPASEQADAVSGAIQAIMASALPPSEQNALARSVVNTYEGTAAGKTEANNQTSVNQAGTAATANTPAPVPAFTGESQPNIIIE